MTNLYNDKANACKYLALDINVTLFTLSLGISRKLAWFDNKSSLKKPKTFFSWFWSYLSVNSFTIPFKYYILDISGVGVGVGVNDGTSIYIGVCYI